MKVKNQLYDVSKCLDIMQYLEDKHDVEITGNLDRVQSYIDEVKHYHDAKIRYAQCLSASALYLPLGVVAGMERRDILGAVPAVCVAGLGVGTLYNYIREKRAINGLKQCVNAEMDNAYVSYVIKAAQNAETIEEFDDILKQFDEEKSAI